MNSLEQAAKEMAKELWPNSKLDGPTVQYFITIIAKHLDAFAREAVVEALVNDERERGAHRQDVSVTIGGFIAQIENLKEQNRELLYLIRDMLEEPLLLPQTMERAREALDKAAIAKGDV